MNRRYRSNRRKPPSRVGRAVARVSWTYLIVLVAFWIFVRVWGDDWWIATLMLFGPLWVTALPLAVLVPAAVLLSPRSLTPLLLSAGVAFFPLLDVCIPSHHLMQWSEPTQHLRILTCNVHGDALDGAALGRLISESKPDVILLQEAYIAWESVAPYAGDVHWHYRRDGELVIASRYPIANAEDFGEPGWQKWGGAAVRYDIAGALCPIHVFNIHLASPHMQFVGVIEQKTASERELEGHLQVRSRQSEKLSKLAREQEPNVLLGGDFNTVCQGAIYHRTWAHFYDAFTVAGSGIGHTYFSEGASLRIDHIFSGPQWRFLHCWVGPDVGSPHRPLIADMEAKMETSR